MSGELRIGAAVVFSSELAARSSNELSA